MQLPEKPSELIRLALDDLRKCEESEEYEIDMGAWVLPPGWSDNNLCTVCLAGAVMAQKFAKEVAEVLEDTNEEVCPWEVTNSETDTLRLTALNDFRLGRVYIALQEMGIEIPDSIPTRIDVADYKDNPTQFHKDMRDMADMFEKEGL